MFAGSSSAVKWIVHDCLVNGLALLVVSVLADDESYFIKANPLVESVLAALVVVVVVLVIGVVEDLAFAVAPSGRKEEVVFGAASRKHQ